MCVYVVLFCAISVNTALDNQGHTSHFDLISPAKSWGMLDDSHSPCWGLKVFSTMQHNQIAPSLCTVFQWHCPGTAPYLQPRYFFLLPKGRGVAHNSKSNKLWPNLSIYSSWLLFQGTHFMCAFFTFFFLSLFITPLARLAVCYFQATESILSKVQPCRWK